MTPILIAVVGPTAAGKTALAIKIARYFNTEIISFDSRQFYREMNIGTAKPSSEELSQVKHHFIDSHSITDYYSAGRFAEDALYLLRSLFKGQKVVVAVGGSGLYLKALTEGLDEMPEVPEEIRAQVRKESVSGKLDDLREELKQMDPAYYQMADLQNPARITRAIEVIRASGKPFSSFHSNNKAERFFETVKVGIDMDREVLYERINKRVDLMIKDGLVEEAKKLLVYRNNEALQTVGYQEFFEYFDGKISLDEAIRLVKRNSRRYAKRQLTWFRKDAEIHWFRPGHDAEVLGYLDKKIPGLEL